MKTFLIIAVTVIITLILSNPFATMAVIGAIDAFLCGIFNQDLVRPITGKAFDLYLAGWGFLRDLL